ncbi:MAG: ATP-binding protein, partial [Spirochaetales bacterium]|nr:ATP-binding protein [Spirochaetales bacterium]
MDFARYGNLPFTLQLFKNSRNINQYLQGLYNTIIVQDIASIHPIKEIKVLDAAMSYMLTHTGISCSSKKLADTLTEQGFKTTQPTAENYLQFMEECGLIYRVGRYDIKDKEQLKSLPMFYAVDMGLSNTLTNKPEMGPILKNLVFLELKRQQYTISAGKIGNNTIDFVATKAGQTWYIQVEAFVKDTKVLNKKLRPFRQIRDFYPRVLISLDKTTGTSESGIRFCNALDFLLNGQL